MKVDFPVTMKKETGFDNLLMNSARLENSYFEALELETDSGDKCSSCSYSHQTVLSSFENDI